MISFLLRMKRFCGFAVGFVFFISGLLKLMDPVGAGLVMKEYFKFLHIGFMNFAAGTLGVIFALAETVIGAALITGVWKKVTALTAIILQGFFTLLTLILLIFNPQMDCGCFGEAIHLTHGETFVKNLIILALLLIYYIPSRHLQKPKKKKYVSFGLVTLTTLAFGIYSILYIPMIDFTDFKSGTIINTDSHLETAQYQGRFIYEKDGVRESFSLENIPDSTWTFVSMEEVSGQNTSEAAATISIYDKDGNYADSLLTSGKIMVISVYDTDISQKTQKQTETFIKNAEANEFQPIILAATEGLKLAGTAQYSCDYKTLITLNRSNAGVTYIENGMIIRKWAKRNLPDHEELAELSKLDSTEIYIERDSKSSLAFQGFLLYVFAVMLLL
jgi:uncharacterized membrane protein YphA (DoxX/SURF4 family)